MFYKSQRRREQIQEKRNKLLQAKQEGMIDDELNHVVGAVFVFMFILTKYVVFLQS